MWCLMSGIASRQGFGPIWWLFILVLLSFLWQPLWLFIFPGILLLYLHRWRQAYLSNLLVLIVGTSMAFWVVSFWSLKYAGVSLLTGAYTIILVSFVLLGALAWKRGNGIAIVLDRQEGLVLLLLGAAMALRLSLYWRQVLAPAGADMSMHGYIAALIVDRNAVPSSHHPLLPIDGFGAYAVGFHTLTALISLVGGTPVYRSALLMEGITFGLLTAAFYLFLRAFWDREIGVVVALIATFLPRDPQNYVAWGGVPTILSLAFVVIGLTLLQMFHERTSTGHWLPCAFLLAASFLTHAIPVVGSFYALIPVAAYWGIRSLYVSPNKIRPVVRNLLGVSMVAAVLLIPYLPDLVSTEVSATEIKWVQDWQRVNSGAAWGGTFANAITTVPQYLKEKVYGGPFLILSSLGFIALVLRRPSLAMPSLIFSLTVVGLVINSMYWVLPLSYAIYPERMALMLLLPFSLSIGALVGGVRHFLGRFVPKDVIIWAVSGLMLVISVYENERTFYRISMEYSLVTAADLQAMQWLRENTGPDDVVSTTYGDAGLWIPAIAFRPITDPHATPFYFDELREGLRSLEAKYVYVGARRVYGEPIARQQFDARPDTFRKVYERDGVTIYEIVSQTAKP